MKKITHIENIPDEVIEFLKKPPSVEKNIEYEYCFKYKNNSFIKKTISEDDDKLHYIFSFHLIKKNLFSFYLITRTINGFTYDKKTKKVNLWKGTTLSGLPMLDFFNERKIDWFKNEPCLHPFLTKTGLEKILSNKITNPVEFCKNYLQINKFKNASPKLFYNSIRKSKGNWGENKMLLFRVGRSCFDINNYFKFMIDHYPNISIEHENILLDTVHQTELLGEKINIFWSLKRLKNEHQKFTRKIMDIYGNHISDEKTNENLNIFEKVVPKNVSLLKTKKEVFIESQEMNHCLFSNYWELIKEGRYVSFSVFYNNERITVGCNYNPTIKRLTLNQAYKKHNETLPSKTMEYVRKIVKEISEKINPDSSNDVIVNNSNTHEDVCDNMVDIEIF